jgi:hypothetical protein
MKILNEIYLMYECMYLKCMDVQMMYTSMKIKIILSRSRSILLKRVALIFFHSKHCKKIVSRIVCHVVEESWLVKS